MARPEKHEYEKRSQQVKIRLTMAEQEHLRSQASTCGQNVAEYVRHRVMGHRVESPARPKFNPTLVSEINRIGVNVNQLSRAVHMDREFVKYWQDIGTQLEAVLDKLVDEDGS